MIQDKLKKVLALAERGEAGERETARRMLNELLAKHNLTLADIASPEVSWYSLRYKYPFERSLMVQILCHITNSASIRTRRYKGKKALHVELTALQYQRFLEFWATYRKPLTDEVQKYIDSVFSAYIAKHHLFPDVETTGSCDMSAEEIARLSAILNSLDDIARPAQQIEE